MKSRLSIKEIIGELWRSLISRDRSVSKIGRSFLQNQQERKYKKTYVIDDFIHAYRMSRLSFGNFVRYYIYTQNETNLLWSWNKYFSKLYYCLRKYLYINWRYLFNILLINYSNYCSKMYFKLFTFNFFQYWEITIQT